MSEPQHNAHWVDWAWDTIMWLQRHRLAKSIELALIIVVLYLSSVLGHFLLEEGIR